MGLLEPFERERFDQLLIEKHYLHSARLGFVVNNIRFLVLPEWDQFLNLAARVLGLCLRRLCADWQQRWDQPGAFGGELRGRKSLPGYLLSGLRL